VKLQPIKSFRLPLIVTISGASDVICGTWILELAREGEIDTRLALQIGPATCVEQHLCYLHIVRQ